MTHAFIPADGWGPDRRRAALSITFDNLGEAAELELDLWEGRPVGVHHTASFIPRLVDVLGNTKTTYFIEASNTELYPEAILAWHAAGHEVALHAWRHEFWQPCAPVRRRELLARSLAAMRTLGIEPVGFRPPGGVIDAEAWREFEEAGLLYCSELGSPGVGRVGQVISVPFQWRGVDVYMLEDIMGFMRLRSGDLEAPVSIEAWRSELDAMLDAALAEGGHRTVIFHPNFLGVSEEKLDVVTHLIAKAKTHDIWVAPVRDVAAFAAAGMRPTSVAAEMGDEPALAHAAAD